MIQQVFIDNIESLMICKFAVKNVSVLIMLQQKK